MKSKSQFRGHTKLTTRPVLNWVASLELLDASRELNAKAGQVEDFLIHSPAQLFRGESPIGEVVTIEVTRVA